MILFRRGEAVGKGDKGTQAYYAALLRGRERRQRARWVAAGAWYRRVERGRRRRTGGKEPGSLSQSRRRPPPTKASLGRPAKGPARSQAAAVYYLWRRGELRMARRPSTPLATSHPGRGLFGEAAASCRVRRSRRAWPPRPIKEPAARRARVNRGRRQAPGMGIAATLRSQVKPFTDSLRQMVPTLQRSRK